MSARDPFPLATAISAQVRESIAALERGESSSLLDAVTPVTRELLRFWFQRDFCDVRQLNFHQGQRAALIAVIYAHEVLGARSLRDLYEKVAPDAMLEGGLLGEVSKARHAHPKYAAKMATGTGKT